MKSLRLLAVSSLIALSTGCSTLGIGEHSNFKCPAIPEGGHCFSADKFYRLTENTEDVDKALKEQKEEKMVAAKARSESPTAVVLPTFKQPVGVLRPPRVARVWIAPWTDSEGALHMPGYTFIEVDPGGWSFGNNVSKYIQPNLHPLEVNTSDSTGPNSTSSDILDSAKAAMQPLEKIAPFKASAQ